MSTTVDERVVEMRFDNKQFEQNIQTSLSSLDKLKKSLNLEGAAKGLETVNDAANKCSGNMSPLSNAVETVRVRFSALEVMAITALQNITNSALAAGKNLVSAFIIDPIKSGFEEYETQINAVQTILANTSSKGTTLDQVNNALDELNHYADMTIYNFTEMTRNIGTFTAAGVDLDTSVAAIKGIANLAAVSGSNSQQPKSETVRFAADAAGKLLHGNTSCKCDIGFWYGYGRSGPADRLEQAVFVGAKPVRIRFRLLVQKPPEPAPPPIFAVRRNILFLRHGFLLFRR